MSAIRDWLCYRLVLILPIGFQRTLIGWSITLAILPHAGNWAYRGMNANSTKRAA